MKGNARRLWASGGHFGYWGKWRSTDGTTFTSFLTHRSEDVYYLSVGQKIIAINATEEWIRRIYD